MHKELFTLIKHLDTKSVNWLMSNAKTTLVEEEFNGYIQEDIEVRRAIHCKKPGTKAMELLVRNY